MRNIQKSAKRRIKETIYSILKDAEFEIKRNPEQKEEINAFCEELMDVYNKFFENYEKKEEIER